MLRRSLLRRVRRVLLNSVRAAWLKGISRNPAVFEAALAVVVILVAYGGLYALAETVPSGKRDVIIAAVGVIAALVISRQARTWGMGRLTARVATLARLRARPGGEFFERLAEQRISETVSLAESLENQGYYASTPEDIAQLCEVMFNNGGYRYVGTDRHVPSSFVAYYGWYLGLHKRSLSERPYSSRSDIRILTVSASDLTTDYLENTEQYLQFQEWHERNGVTLLRIDPSEDERLKALHAIPDIDVGLWPHYAVLFQQDPAGGVRLSIRFPGDKSPHGPSYEDIGKYVEDLEVHARPLGETGPAIELFDPKLASAWADYVGIEQRLDPEGPTSRFLLQALRGRRYVLDAATGVGCESAVLLEHGFSVQSNELDAVLASEAEALASTRQVALNLTRFLWERLPSAIPGNYRFDAVLVLGNSLSLVPFEGRREACVRAFFEMLVPGGVLIVDERNYEQMLRHAAAIEEEPIKHFGPAVSGDVLFRGRRIRAYPSKIAQERVLWDFFLNVPPPETTFDLAEKRLGTPPLELYPFRHGELFELLRLVGFGDIEVYADLSARYETMPPANEVEKNDFLTYIAVKPAA
jgi:glycine/sarcosine N-methyltransferase